MTVRVVTTGVEGPDEPTDFELPTEVLQILDERFSPAGGGIDYGAQLGYQASTPQTIPAGEWTTLVLGSKMGPVAGHDSDDLTWDPDTNAITVYQTGLYLIHAEIGYGGQPATPDVNFALQVNVSNATVGPNLNARLARAVAEDDWPYLTLDQFALLTAGAVLSVIAYSANELAATGNEQFRVVRVG